MNKIVKFLNKYLDKYTWDANTISVKTEQVHTAVCRFLEHNCDNYNIRDKYNTKFIISEPMAEGVIYITFKGKHSSEYDIPLIDLNLKSINDNSTEVSIAVKVLKDGNIDLRFSNTAPNSEDVEYCLNHLETFVYSLKAL